MVNAMRDLMLRIIKNMDVTSKTEVYLMIKYTDFVLTGPALKITMHSCWCVRRWRRVIP